MIKFNIKKNNIFKLNDDIKKDYYQLYEYDNLLFKIKDKSYYYYIIQINYKYELLKPHIIYNDDNYKNVFNFFEFNNEKYHIMKTINNDKKIVSILKYEITDKLFSSYYEIIYKYNNIINGNILEITNQTIGLEAIKYYINKYYIKDVKMYFYNPQINDKEYKDETMNFFNIINNNKYVNNINLMIKEDDIHNIKYDTILISLRRKDKYYNKLYNNQKFNILYILKSLLILNKDGNILLRYKYYTNIEKEIYYLFKKIFKKVKLIIPESKELYLLNDGFILGMKFNNNLNNIKDIINEINNISDDTDIIFNKELDKYFNLEYEKTNNKQKALFSFIDYEDNKKYNDKLLKFHKKIFNKIFDEYKLYLYYVDNVKELMYQKLYYAINWSKKYDFELKDNIYLLNINNDININILYNINKKILHDKIYKYRVKIKDHIINKNMFYDKINNLYNKHKQVTTFIDTRDKSIYRNVKMLLEPFYLKIKNINIKNEYKRYLNQPFFKLYEILHLFNLTSSNNTNFKSFHFCELPGAFIFSLKYFIEKNTNLKLIWKAQSLNEDFHNAKLDDNFKMLKRYNKNYDFGPKNNGNLFYDYNLEYYEKYIRENKIDLITADCGMPNKDESDVIINKLESSILLIGLKTRTNIICKILYPFTKSNKDTIIMIYYMYKYYKKVYFYKPLQTLTNNEFYIICKDFDETRIDDIYNKFDFNEENIDDKYYYSLYKIYKKLIDVKIKAINFKLYLVDIYDIIMDNKELYNEILKINEKIREDWIDKFNFI